MNKKVVFAVVAIAVVGAFFYLVEEEDYSASYVQTIVDYRMEKDDHMNSDSDSPFAGTGIEKVQLNYYPVEEKFRVVAQIERIEVDAHLTLPTSDGVPRVYRKYAYANFKFDNQPYKLLILKGEDSEAGLFLAFSDLTSDESTYGGGRYIDLNFSETTTITLDFNMAYNPYCAYADKYSCPLPPKENDLQVPIEAGEKIYK